VTSQSWFAIAFALMLAIGAIRCARDVPLGVAPTSDAATDAGVSDGNASER